MVKTMVKTKAKAMTGPGDRNKTKQGRTRQNKTYQDSHKPRQDETIHKTKAKTKTKTKAKAKTKTRLRLRL
jgi:hypothetical protein